MDGGRKNDPVVGGKQCLTRFEVNEAPTCCVLFPARLFSLNGPRMTSEEGIEGGVALFLRRRNSFTLHFGSRCHEETSE